ncbi:dCMP deaminase [Pseudomonas phage VB_PaeP_VL1]|uniref:dCMP deaminase n=1 Tax=Pseudomonas phage VB_PaeP_VL1 TaxID=2894395 RepID=A0AAE8YYG2_9CAUD|nr:dCMP deaminase [Pseudomonas phage VB_PaeP_VL1]UGV19839.1 putative dCMP deaminase [Pseudomonas phage VB_PaeP_VL1]
MLKAPDPRSMKYRRLYMSIATNAAKQSVAERHQVGGVLVTTTGALFTGWNGTMPGTDNCCENGEYLREETRFKTTPYGVIHAEHNILAWASRSGVPLDNSVLWITRAPCVRCAEMIATHGVHLVMYRDDHDDPQGQRVLTMGNIRAMSWSTLDSLITEHGGHYIVSKTLLAN